MVAAAEATAAGVLSTILWVPNVKSGDNSCCTVNINSGGNNSSSSSSSNSNVINNTGCEDS